MLNKCAESRNSNWKKFGFSNVWDHKIRFRLENESRIIGFDRLKVIIIGSRIFEDPAQYETIMDPTRS